MHPDDTTPAEKKRISDAAYGIAHREEKQVRERAYRAAHPERYRAYCRAYYQRHRAAELERRKRYSAENPEKVAEKNRRWHEGHPEKVAELQHRYYEEHREEWAERNRRYYKAHRAESLVYWRARKARKLAATGTHTAADIRAQYKRQRGKCFWGRKVNPECDVSLENGFHADHVVPLIKGGSNGMENLVLACPSCNLRKGTKHPMEWACLLL